jgi:hypothetical protein
MIIWTTNMMEREREKWLIWIGTMVLRLAIGDFLYYFPFPDSVSCNFDHRKSSIFIHHSLTSLWVSDWRPSALSLSLSLSPPQHTSRLKYRSAVIRLPTSKFIYQNLGTHIHKYSCSVSSWNYRDNFIFVFLKVQNQHNYSC